MKVELRQGDDVLQNFANGLGALGEGRARKVMARALNRTGGPTLTKVRRELRTSTSAPAAVVRRQVVAAKAWAGDGSGPGKMEFVIRATGRPLPLSLFKPREFRFGVRAKVWGSFQRYEGMFTRGGRWPDRVPLGRGGHVFVRTSAARLPIKRAFGPSLPKELIEDKIVMVWRSSTARLGGDIAHELDRELSKFS
ncbi:MAG: hypothetical protein Q8L59_11155 [Phenylobacterium sp.]|uniref:hypothetical protein n=1 Tax=Phenylobacterium sp. TaxID=1871053 RepID=UPI002736B819|nr:hypothetical protein [Phenylobacterium sp.]MDP1642732.1 hypothetical protein [Phenylobacterium sp.]MDP3117220.1 hypothetical protein [Phenylobacterium sp.]